MIIVLRAAQNDILPLLIVATVATVAATATAIIAKSTRHERGSLSRVFLHCIHYFMDCIQTILHVNDEFQCQFAVVRSRCLSCGPLFAPGVVNARAVCFTFAFHFHRSSSLRAVAIVEMARQQRHEKSVSNWFNKFNDNPALVRQKYVCGELNWLARWHICVLLRSLARTQMTCAVCEPRRTHATDSHMMWSMENEHNMHEFCIFLVRISACVCSILCMHIETGWVAGRTFWRRTIQFYGTLGVREARINSHDRIGHPVKVADSTTV